MSETSIGIKIADGSFYPILPAREPGKKRVILTTVKDNQPGAQIDLYRGNGTGIAGATYVGSLVIDAIEPAPKGDPEIELVMRLDRDGNLDAEATDHVTGEHQSLSVALDTLGSTESYAVSDFDLDERYQPHLGVSPAEATRLTAEPASPDFSGVEEEVRRQRRRRALKTVGLIVLAAIIVAIIVFLLLWFTRRAAPAEHRGPSASSAVAASPSQPSSPAPVAPSAPPAKAKPATTAAAGSAAAGAVPASRATAHHRQGGVMYQIRWGDTLWDLSISFYRTPWLYGKIAKANNIENPNLIFANTEIYIPERR